LEMGGSVQLFARLDSTGDPPDISLPPSLGDRHTPLCPAIGLDGGLTNLNQILPMPDCQVARITCMSHPCQIKFLFLSLVFGSLTILC
jgi:hypothetical protein